VSRVFGVWGDPAQTVLCQLSDRPGLYESLSVTTPPHLGLDGPRQGKNIHHIAVTLRGDPYGRVRWHPLIPELTVFCLHWPGEAYSPLDPFCRVQFKLSGAAFDQILDLKCLHEASFLFAGFVDKRSC
jgi:hypothetical protein